MKKLTREEKRVIIDKGTEMPFVGEYVNNKKTGIYVCRQCEAPLYNSKDKFESDCGWPIPFFMLELEIRENIHEKDNGQSSRSEPSTARNSDDQQ